MSKLAIREQIPLRPGESVFCEHIRSRHYGTPWHFHPELELALVRKSGGYRIVGDSISALTAGDLVLVGCNLPHVWYQDRDAGEVDAIIVQFRDDFAGSLLGSEECRSVRNLYERARFGLWVKGAIRDRVASRIEGLLHSSPLRRISELLWILDELSTARGLEALSSAGYVPPVDAKDHERVSRVMQYIHARLRRSISRREVAEVAALSESAFSRFFRLRTGRTFPAYPNELRLGRAARLLGESSDRIADVARDCGFLNLSHFNRLFLEWKGITPLAFRRRVQDSSRGGD